MALLSSSFYDRDTLTVARDLIGCEIQVDQVRIRITEVEAYCFPGDTANHARFGRTARNAPMWGPPGYAYIYLCYGMHRMLNLVTEAEGRPAAVLIRGAEPVEGLAEIQKRRGNLKGPSLLNGPGKVGAALGLSISQSGSRLDGEIQVFAKQQNYRLVAGPRIGIDYASEVDREAPWRIAMAGSRWVGKRNLLSENA